MKSIFLFIIATSVFAQNIDLKDVQNQYDYVIITVEAFVPTCEVFKSHKEAFNNFSVLITTRDKILAEFNAQQSVQENIRDFISFAGSKWSNPESKYFLLAADLDSIPNFSFKSITHPGYDDTSHSDYYYALDTSDIDSTKLTYPVGRVAARNIQELESYFIKVIRYESTEELKPWHNKALFITDDYYGSDSINYGDTFIKLAQNVSNELPDFMNSQFIIPIDTSQYFGTTDSILVNLNSGQSSVFFSGHGMNEIFTHESLFVATDIDQLTNFDKPFFISIIGAQQFSSKNKTSIVNELILSENGAIGAINSVGIHYVSQGGSLYNKIWSDLFSGISLGETYLTAVNSHIQYSEKRKYNIFGDPSIVLKSDITAEIENITIIPEKIYLAQNCPNPFNPTTIISYTISTSVKSEKSNVKLVVYDVLGREVKVLVNKSQRPGNYKIEFDGSKLTTGIYFYSLTNGNISMTKKMILVK